MEKEFKQINQKLDQLLELLGARNTILTNTKDEKKVNKEYIIPFKK